MLINCTCVAIQFVRSTSSYEILMPPASSEDLLVFSARLFNNFNIIFTLNANTLHRYASQGSPLLSRSANDAIQSAQNR
jgi:hypothetical protein